MSIVADVNGRIVSTTTDDGVLADGEQIRFDIDSDEREHIRDIARARHSSYSSGRTRDESWGGTDDSFGAMERGVAGELVLAALYDDVEFDSDISASGDDGTDGAIRIDGEIRTFDIKTSTYDGPGQSLMVATHHVDERDVVPDVYLRAYVDEGVSEVRLQGWIEADELLMDGMIESSPAGDWRNYDADVNELRAMPVPDTLDEIDCVEIV